MGSPSDLMAFTGLSSNLVKYAVQIRCQVFLQARGTTPPASPLVAFQAAAEVVAHWLVEAKLRLPSLAELADLRGGNQEWWKGKQNSHPQAVVHKGTETEELDVTIQVPK